jgi:2-desacetyl-2-hydroxyethyl bacteriochlorophyllide A dehydrogenase
MTRRDAGAARAVWFAAPERVELRVEEVAEPGPGEILVEAVCSAISHGTELLALRGQIDPSLALDLPTLRGGYGLPLKYGYASVGRVVRRGAEVGLAEGSLVFVHHPHQERYVVPAASAVPLPSEVAPAAGVFLANLETAVTAALDAHPRMGDRVVVLGQGVVGLLALALLRRAGPSSLLAVDGLERRRALAVAMGADEALAPGPDLADEVLARTGGVGADVVLEASGNPAALDLALRCAGFGGTVAVSSWYGSKPVTLDLGGAFHRRRLRVVASQVSTLAPELAPRWTRERRLALAVGLLPGLGVERLITHRVPFARAADAYRLVLERPEEVVQVVLTYGGEG